MYRLPQQVYTQRQYQQPKPILTRQDKEELIKERESQQRREDRDYIQQLAKLSKKELRGWFKDQIEDNDSTEESYD